MTKINPEFACENYEVIPDGMDALANQLLGWEKHYPLKFKLWWGVFLKTNYCDMSDYIRDVHLNPRGENEKG